MHRNISPLCMVQLTLSLWILIWDFQDFMKFSEISLVLCYKLYSIHATYAITMYNTCFPMLSQNPPLTNGDIYLKISLLLHPSAYEYNDLQRLSTSYKARDCWKGRSQAASDWPDHIIQQGCPDYFAQINQIIWELKIAKYKMYTKILAQKTKFRSWTTSMNNPVTQYNVYFREDRNAMRRKQAASHALWALTLRRKLDETSMNCAIRSALRCAYDHIQSY